MSETSNKPWSNGPNTPQITYWVYLGEKENLAGVLIGAIFYGVLSLSILTSSFF